MIAAEAEVSSDSEQRLRLVRELWRTYEQSRAELAQLLYEEREAQRSQGGRGIRGFNTWLKETGIPRATAYRLINEHEITLEPVSRETGFPPEPWTKEDEKEATRLLEEWTRNLDAAPAAPARTNPATMTFEELLVAWFRMMPPPALHKGMQVARAMLHPDRGGDHERAAELNELWQALQARAAE